MSENKVHTGKTYRAIGLMSGTSLDGFIDVALIETDGEDFVKPLDFYSHPYDEMARRKVRTCFGKTVIDEDTQEAEALVTQNHIQAIQASGFQAEIVGFHGQTITHRPHDGFTWQLGDGLAMAKALKCDVIDDFRSNDVKQGGQGAPLAPLYHQALFKTHNKPVCVLNLGGVANVTYIGEDVLKGFDTGPANALMDDYMFETLGVAFDQGGAFASAGEVDQDILSGFLSRDYFSQKPPKSADRNEFVSIKQVLPDNPQDAMATLAELTIQSVIKAQEHFPQKPYGWFVCGGGRKNEFLMTQLANRLGDVLPIDSLDMDGDAIEAECFAYLAVRSKRGLPISLPEITGVSEPLSGGTLHQV